MQKLNAQRKSFHTYTGTLKSCSNYNTSFDCLNMQDMSSSIVSPLTCSSWLKLSRYLYGDFLASRDTRVLFVVCVVFGVCFRAVVKQMEDIKERQTAGKSQRACANQEQTDGPTLAVRLQLGRRKCWAQIAHNSACVVQIYEEAFKHKQMLI